MSRHVSHVFSGPVRTSNPFFANSRRMNTCESVSKQTTLTGFRMNTCKKPIGGWGYRYINSRSLKQG